MSEQSPTSATEPNETSGRGRQSRPTRSLRRRTSGPTTPGGGVPVAPRGRRRDHLTVAGVGVVLAPALFVLAGVAARMSVAGRLPLAVFHAALVLVVAAAAQALFARRSSLGGLVAGLVALLAQGVIILAAHGGHGALFEWARLLVPTGLVLIASALLTGGSWGMRMARRAGRTEARTAARLGESDREIGSTPTAPPSRRHDHVASLVIVAVLVVLALVLIQDGYAELVSPDGAAAAGAIPAVVAWVLLLLAAASSGRSTLGVRTVGPILVVAGLPAFLHGALPGTPLAGLLGDLLPQDPAGISLVATGLLLSALGWGSHLARRQGRTSEQRLLHEAPTV